jgi:hypothetical protein
VHDAVAVRVVEAAGDVADHSERVAGGQRPAPQGRGEVLALHQLHHDQHDFVVGQGVVDRDEVRMVQRGAELGLADEALGGLLGAVRVQALHGNQTAEPLVLAEEDGRHSA